MEEAKLTLYYSPLARDRSSSQEWNFLFKKFQMLKAEEGTSGGSGDASRNLTPLMAVLIAGKCELLTFYKLYEISRAKND